MINSSYFHLLLSFKLVSPMLLLFVANCYHLKPQRAPQSMLNFFAFERAETGAGAFLLTVLKNFVRASWTPAK